LLRILKIKSGSFERVLVAREVRRIEDEFKRLMIDAQDA